MEAQEPDSSFQFANVRGMHLRELDSAEDVGRLQALLEAVPSYCESTIGFPPGPAEAHSSLIARPATSSPEDKVPLGVFHPDGGLMAFADLILRYPQPDRCYIGYVLVHPDLQRQGVGTHMLQAAAQVASERQQECTVAVTWLIETFGKPGLAFLEHAGFLPTGASSPYEVNTISSTRHEYAKRL